MKKLLVVTDMQNDFVTGSLGTKEAEGIVKNVVDKVREWKEMGMDILYTRDTHGNEYLDTAEGKKLPVEHCIKGTHGWEIVDELKEGAEKVMDKPSFGSPKLVENVRVGGYDEVVFVGLCTDICVITNALLLKSFFPELLVSVDAACCAGVTPETHNAALETMRMCQVEVYTR